MIDARRRFWEARRARMQALVGYNLTNDPDAQDALWHEAQAAYYRMRVALRDVYEERRRYA